MPSTSSRVRPLRCEGEEDQVQALARCEIVVGAGQMFDPSARAHHQAIATLGLPAAPPRLKNQRAGPKEKGRRIRRIFIKTLPAAERNKLLTAALCSHAELTRAHSSAHTRSRSDGPPILPPAAPKPTPRIRLQQKQCAALVLVRPAHESGGATGFNARAHIAHICRTFNRKVAGSSPARPIRRRGCKDVRTRLAWLSPTFVSPELHLPSIGLGQDLPDIDGDPCLAFVSELRRSESDIPDQSIKIICGCS